MSDPKAIATIAARLFYDILLPYVYYLIGLIMSCGWQVFAVQPTGDLPCDRGAEVRL